MIELLGFISYLITLYTYIIIANVIMSWLMAFGVMNAYNPMVRSVWQGINAVTEPLLTPLRRLLPPWRLNGLDLSPIFAFLALLFARRFLIVTLMEIAAKLK